MKLKRKIISYPAGLVLVLTLVFSLQLVAADNSSDSLEFDDSPLQEPLSHPDWFQLSFLDLREDLQEALDAGKRGLMVYFGQKYCAYCKLLLEGNFAKKDIKAYAQKYFHVVGIDIHGRQAVTDMEGGQFSEQQYSWQQEVNFTPTIIFYTTGGREALRLSGFYPPYQFRAAMEYVADEHYRKESFRAYLARADAPMVFGADELNYQEFFLRGPHMLDRSRFEGERPLVVFFEQSDCHACDILHSHALTSPGVHRHLEYLEVVQLGLWDQTKVITPEGRRTTAREWGEQLNLFYTPTIIFFDERGREIIRIAAVVQFNRLRNVLDYIVSGAYRREPNYQRWRTSKKDD